jgi:hypothetical protein
MALLRRLSSVLGPLKRAGLAQVTPAACVAASSSAGSILDAAVSACAATPPWLLHPNAFLRLSSPFQVRLRCGSDDPRSTSTLLPAQLLQPAVL